MKIKIHVFKVENHSTWRIKDSRSTNCEKPKNKIIKDSLKIIEIDSLTGEIEIKK